MTRDERLAALRSRGRFDVLVIGGGIAGAGVALEAARRGASVALVEARDFAGGTSSRSSKLVHGGLRYIAQGQWGLTRESVRERDALLREAPGLVRPLRFVLPVRRGDRRGRLQLGLGLALYDLFAGRRTRQWHDAPTLRAALPALDAERLVGGWSYEDAQTDDARLVLRVLDEATRHGAIVANHLPVESLHRDATGLVDGAVVRDALGGDDFALSAAVVVNATGVWADALRGTLGRAPTLRPLRGSHLLLSAARLPLAQAVAFFHPDDGRPVFALPWEGVTMVGTTDLDHRADLAEEPRITREEVDYLLHAARAQFPSAALGRADIVSTWSGVRPVVASGRDVDPSKEAREHLVVAEEGLVTVTGGKLTTFRPSAVEALALAASRLPALRPAAAGGARVFSDAAETAPGREEALRALPPPLAQRWRGRFGPAAATLASTLPREEWAFVDGTDIAWAELRWACRAEAVARLDDLLLRRTRLGLVLPEGGAALLPRLRGIVQAELGWSDARWAEETSRYRASIAKHHALPEDA